MRIALRIHATILRVAHLDNGIGRHSSREKSPGMLHIDGRKEPTTASILSTIVLPKTQRDITIQRIVRTDAFEPVQILFISISRGVGLNLIVFTSIIIKTEVSSFGFFSRKLKEARLIVISGSLRIAHPFTCRYVVEVVGVRLSFHGIHGKNSAIGWCGSRCQIFVYIIALTVSKDVTVLRPTRSWIRRTPLNGICPASQRGQAEKEQALKF